MDEALGVFRGKRVLITGDTGFKGSWLALWLTELGAEVTGVALPPVGERSHFDMLDLNRLIRHVDCDIRDAEALGRVFATARPEIVFHLAAQSLVHRAYWEPKLTFDTNVGGSVNVLEAVREAPSVGAVVYVTSDKCYLNKEWVWGYRENDELGGHDPYSASKAAAEMVYAAFNESYFRSRAGLGVASARAGNVIGGGDWAPNRIVPDCIRALEQGVPIQVRNPRSTRPWQHVLEPLYGYLRLATRLLDEPTAFSGSWNFGPGDMAAFTVNQLVEAIVRHWGDGEIATNASDGNSFEATLLHLNVDKVHLKLGWRTRWNVERVVAESVRWYREVLHGAPAIEMSRSQIRDYIGDR